MADPNRAATDRRADRRVGDSVRGWLASRDRNYKAVVCAVGAVLTAALIFLLFLHDRDLIDRIRMPVPELTEFPQRVRVPDEGGIVAPPWRELDRAVKPFLVRLFPDTVLVGIGLDPDRPPGFVRLEYYDDRTLSFLDVEAIPTAGDDGAREYRVRAEIRRLVSPAKIDGLLARGRRREAAELLRAFRRDVLGRADVP